MFRLILAAALAAFACVAGAAPTLTGAYSSAAALPDTASFTVNGGAAITCAVDKTNTAQAVKCDLASIKSPGVYALTVQVCTAGGIQNTASGAINVQAGCASSGPFSYELRTPAAVGPMLSVSP